MITMSFRSAIVEMLLAKIGLKSEDDVVKELKPHRIQKDKSDVSKDIGFKFWMNQFDLESDKSAMFVYREEARWPDENKEWGEEFVSGCFSDAECFEKSVPKRKVWNFAPAAVISKVQESR